MYKYHRRTSEERREEIEKISQRLEKGIDEYLKSDRYKEILDTFSKFHQYSYGNSILIMLQKPTATQVASYTSWRRDFNRTVRRGEKGIAILAPIPVKIKSENQKLDPVTGNPIYKPDGTPETEVKEFKVNRGFKVEHTFDVSQTEPLKNGKPTPDLDIVHDLTGTVTDYKRLKSAIIAASPVPIQFADFDGDARGFYSSSENRIVIREGMSEPQTLKTLCHEITHSILDNHEEDQKRKEAGLKPVPTMDREVRAESSAYVVASHLGLDTSEYSFPYVATWAGDEKRVKENLSVIKNVSSQIINRIDQQLELQHDQQQTETRQITSVSDKKQLNTEAKELTDKTADFLRRNDPSFGTRKAYKGAAIDAVYRDIRHGKVDRLQKRIDSVATSDQTKAEVKELSNSIQKFAEKVQENISLERTNSLSRSR